MSHDTGIDTAAAHKRYVTDMEDALATCSMPGAFRTLPWVTCSTRLLTRHSFKIG